MSALTDRIREMAEHEAVALRVGDDEIRHSEWHAAACVRAAAAERHITGGPRHVGVLLPNGFEAMYWLVGNLLAGVTTVGLNATRRGRELADDVRHSDCQLIVTDADGDEWLTAAGVDVPRWIVGTDHYRDRLASCAGAAAPVADVTEDCIAALIFTSGTTNAPKAAIRRHGSLAALAERFTESCAITAADVAYNAMPWFHSNALYHAVVPTILSRSALVLRPKFSASNFIHDVRKYGVTRFNYVGKVLEYILATPERDDDADNPIRLASGSEASERDIREFTRRFDVFVRDGFGSTEGGVTIMRTPEMPSGALGVATDETTFVMNPDTATECPRAHFDENGVLLNGADAIGELVNTAGPGPFEGYYGNDEATALRTRGGWYWSGDLAYRDAAGYFYFAGRGHDWLRVDGENFAAAPIERILQRFPGVLLAAVYAVPDPNTGDQVMASIVLADGTGFDPAAFTVFLDGQSDLGTKWRPRFVRVAEALPMTHTNKIRVLELRRHAWLTTDPVWWRRGNSTDYRRMLPADVAELDAAFTSAGRAALAPTPESERGDGRRNPPTCLQEAST